MASSMDNWIRELNEASRLADDINSMISERGSLPASGPETQRHTSAIRRKITILMKRLDMLESTLSKLPKQPKAEKEYNKRQEMLVNLRSRATQMASALKMSNSATRAEKEYNKRQEMLVNLRSRATQMVSALKMSNFATREDLLGASKQPVDEIKRTEGLDNQGIVGLQRQIMREQDEGLEMLEDTILRTKDIALAVNEELGLHNRLIDDLGEHVDTTDSSLRRVQKRLAVLNKRTSGGCTCLGMLITVVGIVILHLCHLAPHQVPVNDV